MMRSYARFERELFFGYRLFLLKIQHQAYGFRGRAKGQGFSAYLKAENIPRRQAHRLIKRYLRMQAIWDRVNVSNAELLREVMGPPPTPEQLEQLEAALEAGE
jgi:hypothetical protein